MDSHPVDQPHVLREYAMLADGCRAALVGPRGDCAWLCAPGFADPPVFGSLLDAGGCYDVTPTDRFVWGGYYEPGTLIWRGRWVTEAGIVECREALAMPPDPHRIVLLRRIVAVQGPAHLRVRLAPRAEFGRHAVSDLARSDSGHWTGRSGPLDFRWVGAADARPQGSSGKETDELVLELTVDEGDVHDLVLELSDRQLPEPMHADYAWVATEREWAERVPDLPDLQGARDARHAVAVLSGLTSPSGGMVAAATTSLPERAREGRNYDYRYVWIRDQCYAGLAAAEAGLTGLVDAAVGFVSARLLDDGPKLQPAYTTGGGRVPDQEVLDVPGYPGGSAVVGNHVNSQYQLDAYGEAMQLLASAGGLDRLDNDGWHAAEVAVEAVASCWQEPEAGIWELDDHRWTQSRLSCVAGLRALAGLADRSLAVRWLSLADTILGDVSALGIHESGRWRRAPEDGRVDASLLLGGLRGAVPADDPRHLETMRAVLDDLTEDGYLYRFRHDSRPLSYAEGAFLICGFWMSEAMAQQGRIVEAARWFERTRAGSGPPGLYTEEFDVRQRQLRGNLPQAFVHAELLRAGVALSRAETTSKERTA